MTDLITAEEAKKLLVVAVPGPWRVDGEPWNRIVWSFHDNRVCFMSHSNGLDDARDIATSNLIAAAPDLARALLASRAELARVKADAAAAQALMVERAATQADPWDGPVTKNKIVDAQAIAAQQIKARIRALAPADGLAAVEALRERAAKAESERRMIVSHATMGNTDGEGMSVNDVSVQITALRNELYLEAKADRDRLAAANAVLEAKVAGLREAVDEQTKARAQHWLRRTMTAPEDAEVEALCERCGYGAVMDAASRLWARKPHGSGAFYIGGCIGFKSDEEARAALATQEAGT